MAPSPQDGREHPSSAVVHNNHADDDEEDEDRRQEDGCCDELSSIEQEEEDRNHDDDHDNRDHDRDDGLMLLDLPANVDEWPNEETVVAEEAPAGRRAHDGGGGAQEENTATTDAESSAAAAREKPGKEAVEIMGKEEESAGERGTATVITEKDANDDGGASSSNIRRRREEGGGNDEFTTGREEEGVGTTSERRRSLDALSAALRVAADDLRRKREREIQFSPIRGGGGDATTKSGKTKDSDAAADRWSNTQKPPAPFLPAADIWKDEPVVPPPIVRGSSNNDNEVEEVLVVMAATIEGGDGSDEGDGNKEGDDEGPTPPRNNAKAPPRNRTARSGLPHAQKEDLSGSVSSFPAASENESTDTRRAEKEDAVNNTAAGAKAGYRDPSKLTSKGEKEQGGTIPEQGGEFNLQQPRHQQAQASVSFDEGTHPGRSSSASASASTALFSSKQHTGGRTHIVTSGSKKGRPASLSFDRRGKSVPVITSTNVHGGAGDLTMQQAGQSHRRSSWRSAEGDMDARREMVRYIAALLTSRKRSVGSTPTDRWRADLPHKARRLEERLYLTASSLEDYLDRRTIKGRLGAVAKGIAARHCEQRRRKGDGGGGKRRWSSSAVKTLGGRPSSSGASGGDGTGGIGGGAKRVKMGSGEEGGEEDGREMLAATDRGDDGRESTEGGGGERGRQQRLVGDEGGRTGSGAGLAGQYNSLQEQILHNIREQKQLLMGLKRGSDGTGTGGHSMGLSEERGMAFHGQHPPARAGDSGAVRHIDGFGDRRALPSPGRADGLVGRQIMQGGGAGANYSSSSLSPQFVAGGHRPVPSFVSHRQHPPEVRHHHHHRPQRRPVDPWDTSRHAPVGGLSGPADMDAMMAMSPPSGDNAAAAAGMGPAAPGHHRDEHLNHHRADSPPIAPESFDW